MLSPHALDPARVLRLVTALGGTCKRVLLVACEPLTFGGEEGVMGLSEPVAAALDGAVAAVEDAIALIEIQQAADRDAPSEIQLWQQGVSSL
jgi:hydrogenase maturation protease